ncbi:hypothetical protein C8F01DRAFT_39225 [Mycena amicta]|nr:hypothetical protein C8F01DRAFT_39225 [Mycena amicta]
MARRSTERRENGCKLLGLTAQDYIRNMRGATRCLDSVAPDHLPLSASSDSAPTAHDNVLEDDDHPPAIDHPHKVANGDCAKPACSSLPTTRSTMYGPLPTRAFRLFIRDVDLDGTPAAYDNALGTTTTLIIITFVAEALSFARNRSSSQATRLGLCRRLGGVRVPRRTIQPTVWVLPRHSQGPATERRRTRSAPSCGSLADRFSPFHDYSQMYSTAHGATVSLAAQNIHLPPSGLHQARPPSLSSVRYPRCHLVVLPTTTLECQLGLITNMGVAALRTAAKSRREALGARRMGGHACTRAYSLSAISPPRPAKMLLHEPAFIQRRRSSSTTHEPSPYCGSTKASEKLATAVAGALSAGPLPPCPRPSTPSYAHDASRQETSFPKHVYQRIRDFPSFDAQGIWEYGGHVLDSGNSGGLGKGCLLQCRRVHWESLRVACGMPRPIHPHYRWRWSAPAPLKMVSTLLDHPAPTTGNEDGRCLVAL